jgi:hypothetical protein
MTTEAFIELRSKELRHFFRVIWGRRWRYILAKRMGRSDAPRWLVARPGKCRVTLAKLIPVERLAVELGFNMGCPRFHSWQKRCPEDAPQNWGPAYIQPAGTHGTGTNPPIEVKPREEAPGA